MAIKANHHVFRFEISVKIARRMKDFQRGKHLIADKSDCFKVKFLSFFFKYVIDAFLKFFHYQEWVGSKGFQTVNDGKYLSLGEFGQNFELFFNQDGFLWLSNIYSIGSFLNFTCVIFSSCFASDWKDMAKSSMTDSLDTVVLLRKDVFGCFHINFDLNSKFRLVSFIIKGLRQFK